MCITTLPGDARSRRSSGYRLGSSFDEVFAADLAVSEPAGPDSTVPSGAGEGRSRVIRRGRTGRPDHGAVEPVKAGATNRRSTDLKRFRSPSPSSIPRITIFVRLPNHKWMSDRGSPGDSSLLAMAVSR
jgi:hypothetical protein